MAKKKTMVCSICRMRRANYFLQKRECYKRPRVVCRACAKLEAIKTIESIHDTIEHNKEINYRESLRRMANRMLGASIVKKEKEDVLFRYTSITTRGKNCMYSDWLNITAGTREFYRKRNKVKKIKKW